MPNKKINGHVDSVQDKDGSFWVQFIGLKTDGSQQYRGPLLRIEHDEEWLHLVTDDYEGNNILDAQDPIIQDGFGPEVASSQTKDDTAGCSARRLVRL